jgi:carboxymethylenebutenolidase
MRSAAIQPRCVPHAAPLRGAALPSRADDPAEFYRDHFIGQWTSDTTITPISRTVGDDQIVDKILIVFRHDRVIDCILPGAAPTGRKIEVPTVAIVRFEGGKVARGHLYWDQGSVLVQARLIDPEGLLSPVPRWRPS